MEQSAVEILRKKVNFIEKASEKKTAGRIIAITGKEPGSLVWLGLARNLVARFPESWEEKLRSSNKEGRRVPGFAWLYAPGSAV